MVQRKQLKIPDWYKKLPEEKISQKVLDSLSEYSCSIPTGQTIGKVWKRNVNWGCAPLFCGKPEPLWLICEYTEHKDPSKIGIEYRKPLIKE